MNIAVNYTAVAVAGIVYYGIGALWYTVIFGKMWMEAMGITKESMQAQQGKGGMTPGKAMGLQFINNMVTAYVLAMFIVLVGANTAAMGLQTGFWAWLGFQATLGVSELLFEKKNTRVVLINAGMNLVGLLVMGAILASWK